MERYQWEGITLEGQRCTGQDVAGSVSQLQELLHMRGIGFLRANQAGELLGSQQKRSYFFNFMTFFKPRTLSVRQKISFFEQAAILIESGIDIVSVLQVVESQARGVYKQKIGMLMQKVQQGFSLAQAAIKIDIFDSLEQELMAAAEQTGNSVSVLKELAQYAQHKVELKKKISRATLIPIITLCVALVVVFILSHVVLPGFETLFASMNKSVPALSQALFSIARVLRMLPLSVAIGIGIFGLLLSRIEKAKSFLHTYIIHIIWYLPVLRSCIIEHSLSHYFQATRLYCMSGVPLEQALIKSLEIVSFLPYKDKLQAMCEYVQQGYSFSGAAQKIGAGFVPDECVTLLVVGEKSSNITAMLKRACLLLDYSLKRRMSVITSSIGPVMLLLVGGIVALVMVAVYIPIFTFARMF